MNNGQLQYEINSAINVCNGRIENGANIEDAFEWLNDDTVRIFAGEFIYSEYPEEYIHGRPE